MYVRASKSTTQCDADSHETAHSSYEYPEHKSVCRTNTLYLTAMHRTRPQMRRPVLVTQRSMGCESAGGHTGAKRDTFSTITANVFRLEHQCIIYVTLPCSDCDCDSNI